MWRLSEKSHRKDQRVEVMVRMVGRVVIYSLLTFPHAGVPQQPLLSICSCS